MHRFFIKTPWWARTLFPDYVWRIPSKEKTVYLTFDDGPHPTITPWVLEELDKHQAKATFFCIGNNVSLYPDVYAQIIAGGHSVGNHTQRHLNGWKTKTDLYLQDVEEASQLITSNLFRPPYGKIKTAQAKGLRKALRTISSTVVMWDVLSADFDTKLSPVNCMENVCRHVEPGSVVVFHDSEKAFPNLRTALPAVLSRLSEAGYGFEKIAIHGS